MKTTGVLTCFAVLFIAQDLAVGAEPKEDVLTFRGMCDASAAVALDEQTFIVGGDGSNVLRVYKAIGDGTPVSTFDLTAFLGSEPVDIEGAARAGDRIYWIGSHSRDQQGQVQLSRYCFFVTAIEERNGAFEIEPLGKPCAELMQKMVGLNTVGGMRVDKALRWNESLSQDEQRLLAPDKEGLNIEALCASSIDERLHIGFRNPRPVRVTTARVSAAAVPLQNPRDVTEQGKAPIFGEGILWDFGGLGISSMEYSPYHKAYFVIAAPHTDEGRFALYRWSGMKTFSPDLVRPLDIDADGFKPETLVAFADSRRLLVLSDDTRLNEPLADPDAMTFRAVWVEP